MRLPSRLAGIMLTALPLRRMTRLLAHMSVAPRASKSPSSNPLLRLPENISIIPPKQIMMASQVCLGCLKQAVLETEESGPFCRLGFCRG